VSEHPRISICICTRDRAGSLRETVAAVLSVIPKNAGDIEILVVDNASTDETRDVIAEASERDHRVRHVFEPYAGVSRARNTAFRLSRGSILVCIDDDVRPQPGWLEEMTRPISIGVADAVAGRVILPQRLKQPWMTSFFRIRLGESLPDRKQHAPLISANMALSSEVFQAVRFDEELGPGQLGMSDDVLLDYQIQAAGFRVVAAEDAVVVHEFDPGRLTRAAVLELARANARSDAYLWRHWLNSDLGWLRWRLVAAVALWLAAQVRYPGAQISESLYQASYRIEFIRRLRLERRRRARYPDPPSRSALQESGRRLRSEVLSTAGRTASQRATVDSE
jgi:glycosyltransferase involved in cell wall biosynthesis